MEQSSPSATTGKSSCGCIGTILALILLCIAGVAIPEINDNNNLNAGIRAYENGDCREAIQRFNKVIESFDWGIVDASPQANMLKEECVAFQNAIEAENRGNFGVALTHYLDFPKIYPASKLNTFIPSGVSSLFGKAPVEDLAIKGVCDRVALLGESNLIPRPEEQLPELYYYCGETYEKLGDFENALIMYYQILTDYPIHIIGEQATAGYARVEIQIAERAGAGSIAQPEKSGDAPIGTSVYIVRNDSPEKIQVILSGPEVIIEEIPKCEICQTYSSDVQFCPEEGPVSRITLKPGTYDVLVKSVSDTSVTPYRGTWTFESGAEYSECYYVVTSTSP